MASFALPATKVVEEAGTAPGTPITGWSAFTSSIYIPPLALMVDPRLFAFFVFVPANALMLVTLPIALILPRGGVWFAPLLMLAGTCALTLPPDLCGDVFIGYYVWAYSFFALSLACLAAWFAERRCGIPEPLVTALQERT